MNPPCRVPLNSAKNLDAGRSLHVKHPASSPPRAGLGVDQHGGFAFIGAATVTCGLCAFCVTRDLTLTAGGLSTRWGGTPSLMRTAASTSRKVGRDRPGSMTGPSKDIT